MKKPKVLYAFCGTGQGHMAKAAAFEQELRSRYDVEFLASSLCNPLIFDVDHILEGATLTFDENAKLDFISTFWDIDAKNFIQEAVSTDLSKYDFVINDHDPVTTTSAYIQDYKNIFTLSHQASFLYKETPRANVELRNLVDASTFDLIIKGYSRNKKERCFGIHFDRYHENIFHPVLRKEILEMTPTDDGSCLVYLPKHSKQAIHNILSKFPKQKFFVFDPKKDATPEIFGNVTFFKTDKEMFMRHLQKSSMAIINAGFELPSELMYLGKKFLAIPQFNQYEQECNAVALEKIGIPTSLDLDTSSVSRLLNDNTTILGQRLSNPSEILDIIESKVE